MEKSLCSQCNNEIAWSHQCPIDVCGGLENEMKDIMRARPYTTTFETAVDMVMLGYIIGIRAERKRKAESQRKAVQYDKL